MKTRLFSFLLCSLIFGISACKKQESPAVLAQDGIMDLSEWDFEKNGTIRLAGEWDFYWNQLVAPDSFLQNSNIPKANISVPQPWNKQSFPTYGFATYRLQIYTNPNTQKLAVRLQEIRDAYNLWINGKQVLSQGIVATNTYNIVPQGKTTMTTFEVNSEKIDLILQVANFRSQKSGIIRNNILLGTEANILKLHEKSIAIVVFLCGCYLIIGLYHFFFFLMRKRYTGALHFSLLSLLIILRTLSTGDKLLLDWTAIPGSINSKIAYVSAFFAVLFFLKYLKALFPKEISTSVVKFYSILSLLLANFVMVAPSRLSYMATRPFMFCFCIIVIYLLYRLYFIIKNKRKGSLLFGFGVCLVLISTFNDAFLVHENNMGFYWFSFGILAFMLLQTLFLARQFADNTKRIIKLSRTFRKFVPIQFLERLNIERNETLRTGIAQEEILTISFLDIRSFTKLSEKMSSQQLLDFLNAFFGKMSYPIHKNHGFIDKFIGDSIMSVFDRKKENFAPHAADAVKAAIEMHEIHKRENGKGKINTSFKFGVGIHTDKVILGTVGANQRMDSTVIGDGVNLAARLESLTKKYQAQIIISEATLQRIDTQKYAIRPLDKVVVKGKSKAILIYEVFDANPTEIKIKKLSSLKDFRKAMHYYFKGNWENAIFYFERSLQIYPEDYVAKQQLEKLKNYSKMNTQKFQLLN